MTTVSFATENDRAAMMSLWQIAFEDTPDEITAFFDRFFSLHTALVVRVESRVVSMLFLLPTVIETPAERVSVGYIYGGATLPSARGNGYYRRLLAFACEVARDRGMRALFLRPADKALDESYRRMGFTVPLVAAQRDTDEDVRRCEATALTSSQYVDLRRRMLRARRAAFVDWEDATAEHCLSWCRAYAFGQTACALFSEDFSTAWDYVSLEDTTLCVPSDAPRVPVHWRTVGNGATVGRLCPLDDTEWKVPVYMGYGME